MVSKVLSSSSTESQLQAQPQRHEVTIRNLYNDRNLYGNYPDIQRGKVWPIHFKRALIDSILRGLPIPPLLTYTTTDEDGLEKHLIIDGQQRLETVYAFRDGDFNTATLAINRKSEPNSLPPIEPGKYYQHLSPQAQNVFNQYTFIINTFKSIDDRTAGLIFRRLQNQVPLSMAEKLSSYDSKTRSLALDLKEHPIWEECYSGGHNRKQLFQGGLCLIILELTQGFASLSGGRLKEYASGLKDEKITPELREAIESRLEVVMHVFAETTFHHWAEVIPMYQAILFLEQRGHTFTSSDKGCLSSWFGRVQYEASQDRRRGFASPLVKLIYSNMQREFWEEELPVIEHECQEKATVISTV